MEYHQFKYSFGTPQEIIGGEIERVDSLDELPEVSSEIIIVPRLIGVYQTRSEENDVSRDLDNLSQVNIFCRVGKVEDISPELICVGYDPTITPEDILKKLLEGDVLDRLKAVRHNFIYDIDFNEKPSPYEAISKVRDIAYRLSEGEKRPLGLDGIITCLRGLKEDYGLIRKEAVVLEMAKKLYAESEGREEIIRSLLF